MSARSEKAAHDPAPARSRTAALLIVCGLVAFLALQVVAAVLYPGGTWFDRRLEGYSFIKNFLCDALHDPALNGAPNPGAGFAAAGLFALVPALVGLWYGAARLFPPPARGATVMRVLGALSLVGAAAVPIAPSDRYPLFHSLAVLSAGGPGVLAGVIAVVGTVRGATLPRLFSAAGVGAVVFASANLALYVPAAMGSPPSPWLPGIQKAATVLAVIWMCGVARALQRRGCARDSSS